MKEMRFSYFIYNKIDFTNTNYIIYSNFLVGVKFS